MCGNYNDDDQDDFQTPSGGVAEVSANLFGDSWRLQSYCPEALEISVNFIFYYIYYLVSNALLFL